MSLEQTSDKKGAAVKFPPPLIMATVILFGYGLHWVKPLPINQAPALFMVGCGMILFALTIIAFTAISFFRARTHIEPWKPTSAIISTGIFRISRNPIYVGFCISTIGAGFILNSWWIVIAVIPLIWLLTIFVIRLEESYLLRKFGQEYRDYQQRVRRWL